MQRTKHRRKHQKQHKPKPRHRTPEEWQFIREARANGFWVMFDTEAARQPRYVLYAKATGRKVMPYTMAADWRQTIKQAGRIRDGWITS